ncbi:MAG: nuclear transport factor 2 family protein [Gemmatimonadales bacterium]|nr:nuclear transport factor 2 family protein [Gemmatimonadales bacterium]
MRILDVYRNVASVRTTMAGWIDYMQLARMDGRWVIVNVLWEEKPGGERRG